MRTALILSLAVAMAAPSQAQMLCSFNGNSALCQDMTPRPWSFGSDGGGVELPPLPAARPHRSYRPDIKTWKAKEETAAANYWADVLAEHERKKHEAELGALPECTPQYRCGDSRVCSYIAGGQLYECRTAVVAWHNGSAAPKSARQDRGALAGPVGDDAQP